MAASTPGIDEPRTDRVPEGLLTFRDSMYRRVNTTTNFSMGG